MNGFEISLTSNQQIIKRWMRSEGLSETSGENVVEESNNHHIARILRNGEDFKMISKRFLNRITYINMMF